METNVHLDAAQEEVAAALIERTEELAVATAAILEFGMRAIAAGIRVRWRQAAARVCTFQVETVPGKYLLLCRAHCSAARAGGGLAVCRHVRSAARCRHERSGLQKQEGLGHELLEQLLYPRLAC